MHGRGSIVALMIQERARTRRAQTEAYCVAVDMIFQWKNVGSRSPQLLMDNLFRIFFQISIDVQGESYVFMLSGKCDVNPK